MERRLGDFGSKKKALSLSEHRQLTQVEHLWRDQLFSPPTPQPKSNRIKPAVGCQYLLRFVNTDEKKLSVVLRDSVCPSRQAGSGWGEGRAEEVLP